MPKMLKGFTFAIIFAFASQVFAQKEAAFLKAFDDAEFQECSTLLKEIDPLKATPYKGNNVTIFEFILSKLVVAKTANALANQAGLLISILEKIKSDVILEMSTNKLSAFETFLIALDQIKDEERREILHTLFDAFMDAGANVFSPDTEEPSLTHNAFKGHAFLGEWLAKWRISRQSSEDSPILRVKKRSNSFALNLRILKDKRSGEKGSTPRNLDSPRPLTVTTQRGPDSAPSRLLKTPKEGSRSESPSLDTPRSDDSDNPTLSALHAALDKLASLQSEVSKLNAELAATKKRLDEREKKKEKSEASPVVLRRLDDESEEDLLRGRPWPSFHSSNDSQ